MQTELHELSGHTPHDTVSLCQTVAGYSKGWLSDHVGREVRADFLKEDGLLLWRLVNAGILNLVSGQMFLTEFTKRRRFSISQF